MVCDVGITGEKGGDGNEDDAEDDLEAIMQDLPRSKAEILNSGLQLAGKG